jgi:hypothetical protein
MKQLLFIFLVPLIVESIRRVYFIDFSSALQYYPPTGFSRAIRRTESQPPRVYPSLQTVLSEYDKAAIVKFHGLLKWNYADPETGRDHWTAQKLLRSGNPDLKKRVTTSIQGVHRVLLDPQDDVLEYNAIRYMALSKLCNNPAHYLSSFPCYDTTCNPNCADHFKKFQIEAIYRWEDQLNL